MMPEKLNIRPYNNKETLLFPPSIGDYLPKDDLAVLWVCNKDLQFPQERHCLYLFSRDA
ncbi:MAG: hypothetical protein ACUVQP_03695 [Bacteroidales bacterium]